LKPRRVVISFDIETDLPVKVLRDAWLSVQKSCEVGRFKGHQLAVIKPVNRPRVEVIQPVKRKGKR